MSSSSSISKKAPQTHLLHVDTTTTTTNASSSSHRSPPRPSASATGGGGGSGQNQACAACKYQRRKCNPDCPLARYFPADQQRRFLHAHRLFGVSNIQKTLRRIDPEYGPEAMRALIYQSEARAADPVYGCVGIIKRLEHEVNVANAELQALRQQIAFYRHQAAVAAAGGGDPAIVAADPAAAVLAAAGQGNGVAMAMDALYGAGDQDAGFVVVHDHHQADYHSHAGLKVDDQQDQPAAIPLYDYFCYDGASGGDEATSQDATVHNGYTYSDAASVKQQMAGSPAMSTLGQQMEQHCQIEAAPPLVDAFDVKPHDLPAAIMEQHLGHGGDGIEQPEHKVGVINHSDDVTDRKMAVPAAAAQCHLELGFSSF